MAVLCWAALAGASTRPDFSGSWQLALTKSDLGPMPAPKAMTLKIQHKDPELRVITMIVGGPEGDLNYEAKYTTDGKDNMNRLSGHEAHSSAIWDGNALVLQTKADFGGGEMDIRSRWLLLEGGKILKQSVHVTTQDGSFDLTYVFEREIMR